MELESMKVPNETNSGNLQLVVECLATDVWMLRHAFPVKFNCGPNDLLNEVMFLLPSGICQNLSSMKKYL
jgi:hypothetical protein